MTHTLLYLLQLLSPHADFPGHPCLASGLTDHRHVSSASQLRPWPCAFPPRSCQRERTRSCPAHPGSPLCRRPSSPHCSCLRPARRHRDRRFLCGGGRPQAATWYRWTSCLRCWWWTTFLTCTEGAWLLLMLVQVVLRYRSKTRSSIDCDMMCSCMVFSIFLRWSFWFRCCGCALSLALVVRASFQSLRTC
ncbi:hypothetical protein EJ02DRAFT_120581 [Clathrospora elynae]|uniref:Uncharacterized protein n=1 Tax=Clathrospora elynae TaxID=706981 RepID=A0A6A5T3T0_9PLEO|nr:hypothetical protein EJ02DRAFT_120581 [Clathrospora elynae]